MLEQIYTFFCMIGFTIVRDMAYHKLSCLLMFEFRVRATTEDARSTAEANHSDKWKKKWMVFYASVGYANHEQFRNMGLLWTLKSVPSVQLTGILYVRKEDSK